KNIESSFKQIRLFAIIFICLCVTIAGYSIWSSYNFAEAQREKIYVLDGGKSLMLALSQDLAQNRPVEAREHVKRFHELFFTLSPDKSAIESNINLVLQVDSVVCNFDKYPYKVATYSKQMIIRESNVTERSLVTRCNLLNSVRSDNNPHGFTIEAFEIVENRDIRVVNR
ncbi:MAG: conjugative transposon protein TraK, partial [Bacteroides sp.]